MAPPGPENLFLFGSFELADKPALMANGMARPAGQMLAKAIVRQIIALNKPMPL